MNRQQIKNKNSVDDFFDDYYNRQYSKNKSKI